MELAGDVTAGNECLHGPRVNIYDLSVPDLRPKRIIDKLVTLGRVATILFYALVWREERYLQHELALVRQVVADQNGDTVCVIHEVQHGCPVVLPHPLGCVRSPKVHVDEVLQACTFLSH